MKLPAIAQNAIEYLLGAKDAIDRWYGGRERHSQSCLSVISVK